MLVKTRQCLVERRTSVASERDIGDTGILLTCINDEASMRMKLEVSDRFYPAFHFKLAVLLPGCIRLQQGGPASEWFRQIQQFTDLCRTSSHWRKLGGSSMGSFLYHPYPSCTQILQLFRTFRSHTTLIKRLKRPFSSNTTCFWRCTLASMQWHVQTICIGIGSEPTLPLQLQTTLLWSHLQGGSRYYTRSVS